MATDAGGLRVVIGDTTDIFCFATKVGERRYGEISFDGTAGFVRLKGGTVVRQCGVGGRLGVGG